ncbi:MFS transporter, partial [Streptomyces sp. SID10244]|nr:MFS transporter [Streptomyces sp. SID10244]
PWHQAGAGAGVYNTTRMIGSVLGSAAVGALMQTRLAAQLPGVDTEHHSAGGQLPEMVRDGFATAMGQSLYLPAVVLLFGVVAALFFMKPKHQTAPGVPPVAPEQAGEGAATGVPTT